MRYGHQIYNVDEYQILLVKNSLTFRLHLLNQLEKFYMEPKTFCQSCGMPIDYFSLRGTEVDGSRSEEYCTYCYQHGHFIQPNVTLDEMKSFVKKIMEEKNIAPFIIEQAVSSLPDLKRWRGKMQSNTIIM
jgi:hypothetical protein